MRLLIEHLPAAMLIGIVGWIISAEPMCMLAAALGGWLIDVDHVIDFGYYIWKKKEKFSLALLKTGEYFKSNGKVYVPLHSWELVVILGCMAILEKSYVLACGALSMGIHLFQDQLSYHVRPTGYIFISRVLRKFDIKNFCSVKNVE